MEQLKHECGVAMIRLLQPLEYYEKKYGTWMYGLNKLYLLMEKQHNRGQEGAGLACVKLEANPGEEYMFRERALGSGAITEIFEAVQSNFKDLTSEQLHDAAFAKRTLPFALFYYRKIRNLVRTSVFKKKQLACQKSGSLRKLQYDECR